ncbi:MAG: DUF6429 family protein [Leptothrix sp. (in: b-proteobacteria)]
MPYNQQKIEDTVLALLGAFEFENGRVWKRLDFSVMDALAERGMITNPRGRAESVYLTPEGLAKAKELAQKMFGE